MLDSDSLIISSCASTVSDALLCAEAIAMSILTFTAPLSFFSKIRVRTFPFSDVTTSILCKQGLLNKIVVFTVDEEKRFCTRAAVQISQKGR